MPMIDGQEEVAEVVCSNPDCQVAQDGKCVEGLDLAGCPHYGHALVEEVNENIDANEMSVSNVIDLPGAGILTVQETAHLLRAGPARVIGVIGPFKSGKTSLITSLYELFQEGPVAGIEFARSRSFHAFEEAVHDIRAASRRDAPEQERTKRGEVGFYHIDVGGCVAGDILSLLLADRSGEDYSDATDDASIAASFPEVIRADSLALVVDGARLLDAGARHNLLDQLKMILQALIDGGAIKSGQRLAVVLTKIDLIQVSPDKERAEKDFKRLIVDIKRLFVDVFSTIKSFEVAASPSTELLERGTGVADLFAFWVEQTATPSKIPLPRPEMVRAFAQLQPLNVQEPRK